MKPRRICPDWSIRPPGEEPFVIARAGKPLVKVAALSAPEMAQRLDFLAGEITVPDDFDRMGETEIAALFGTRA